MIITISGIAGSGKSTVAKLLAKKLNCKHYSVGDFMRQIAKEKNIPLRFDEVNAMTLATVDAKGKPSARIVLLKGYTHDGFVFFTNYESAKGQELSANPNAALLFFWKELERQIRIEGTVEKISEADSDAYFHSRPAGSRIGAWVSPQSKVIPGRNFLEENYQKLMMQYPDENKVPRPPHWGGYIVKPVSFEFWQGRSSRLHDRLSFTQNAVGEWIRVRLAP